MSYTEMNKLFINPTSQLSDVANYSIQDSVVLYQLLQKTNLINKNITICKIINTCPSNIWARTNASKLGTYIEQQLTEDQILNSFINTEQNLKDVYLF